jgi:hypothetical protein
MRLIWPKLKVRTNPGADCEGIGLMDIFDATLSTERDFNEQLAHEVLNTLPEEGPLVAILDRDGRIRAGDCQMLASLGLTDTLLEDCRVRVGDGVDPVTAQIGETHVTVAQLTTERGHGGYLLVALPQATVTVPGIDLVEALLSQIAAVVRLLQRNDALTRASGAHLGPCGAGGGPTN